MSLTFRLAWRDLTTHKTTAILAVVLFALPMAAILALATAGSSATTQASEPLQRYSSAFLSYGTCGSTSGPNALCLDSDHVHLQDVPGDERLAQQFGDDIDFHPLYQTDNNVELISRANATSSSVVAFDAPDADRENFPAPGEVFLPSQVAFILDVEEGDMVRIGQTEVTVASTIGTATVQVSPENFPEQDKEHVGQWFSTAPQLPEAQPGTGIRTTNSPVGRTDPRILTTFTLLPDDAVLPAILMGLMALLLMVAIVGPIFAVAGRRQRRTMGLLSASGAGPRTLRGILFWQAAIVATAGGVLGIVASLPLGWAVLDVLGVEATQFLWPWDLALAGWFFALACAVAAAVQPALAAGREEPVSALAGGSTPHRLRLRPTLLIGPAILALGVLGSATGSRAFVLVTGIGVLLSGGVAVWALSKMGGYLPLAARLAARDLMRQASRSAPGVAAIAGVVFVAVMAVALPTASTLGSAGNLVMVSATQQSAEIGRNIDNVNQVVEKIGDGDVVRQDVFVPAPDQPYIDSQPPLPSVIWQQQIGIFSDIAIAGPALLQAFPDLSEEQHEQAAAALEAGAGVIGTSALGETIQFSNGQSLEVLPLISDPEFGLLITPDTAASLGITPAYVASALVPEDSMSNLAKTQLAVTNAGLDPTLATVLIPGLEPTVVVFTLAPVLLSFLIAFGVVALIIYLSATESRRDLRAIWSVGAKPSILRRFTGAQGAMIAAGAVLLGLIAGALTSAMMTLSSDSATFADNQWFTTPVLVLAIGLPLAGWLTGTLFGMAVNQPSTHSRQPPSRAM